MADVVKSEIVQDHAIPIILFELPGYMPCHVIIHISEILVDWILVLAYKYIFTEESLTETKKLEVPSAREKTSGNSFNQVSSPYMTNFPPCFAFSCASQLS